MTLLEEYAELNNRITALAQQMVEQPPVKKDEMFIYSIPLGNGIFEELACKSPFGSDADIVFWKGLINCALRTKLILDEEIG